MRAGLHYGSVALIGGIYYTRTALNHSLYPGTPCGTYKNKTFTLDVYPWLSAALDGMLLCAPSPGVLVLLVLCTCASASGQRGQARKLRRFVSLRRALCCACAQVLPE